MDLGIIITAAIGVVTSFTSAWISWFFTRKKYSAEVDETVIHNMKESLEFYQKLSDDNKNRLDSMIKRNEELEEEMKDLRRQVSTLMNYMCIDLTCQLRKRNLNLFNEQNGTNSRQKVEDAELYNKQPDNK